MKFFSRETTRSGRVHIRIFGVKVLSYEDKKLTPARPEGMVESTGADNVFENVPWACRVRVYGSHNRIRFAPDTDYFSAEIAIGAPDCPVVGADVLVAGGVLCNGATIVIMEDNSRVSIGRDSILSEDVDIWCSDTHAILSPEGELLNRGRFVEIGERCWIGKGAFVLKNSKIAAGSIVGAHAVVSGGGEEESVVWAGNPARIVRRNVVWDRRRPNEFVRKVGEQGL